MNQTYKNLQIILIDDGSKDGSPAICDSYAAADDRVKVIHKENGGVSSARNMGIDSADGQWLMFVDSDDTLQLDAVEALLKEAGEECDLIVGSFISDSKESTRDEIRPRYFKVSDDKRNTLALTMLRSPSMMFRELFPGEMRRGPILTGPWMKLYKCSVIKENGIYFDTSMKVGEDCYFNTLYVQNIQTICFVDYGIYNYRVVENSAIHNIDNHINGWKPYFEKMLPIVEENDLFSFYYRKAVYILFVIIKDLAGQNKKNGSLSELSGKLRKICKESFFQSAIRGENIKKIPGMRRKALLLFLRIRFYKLAVISAAYM